MMKRPKSKKNVNLDNYLDKVPSPKRGLAWEESGGYVTVLQENTGFYNGLAQKFFGAPKTSHIDLDEFGSFVWLQMNGIRSIYEIGQLVKKEFGEEAEPLYERLATYFYTLEQIHYVEYEEA